jgi:HSP20 family molecular chaperone IbpA
MVEGSKWGAATRLLPGQSVNALPKKIDPPKVKAKFKNELVRLTVEIAKDQPTT